MKKLYCLLLLLVVTVPFLAAQNQVDSLYNRYASGINIGKQPIIHQLLAYFVQQNYYDYPVSLEKKYTRTHSDMLINLGMAKLAYNRSDLDNAILYARKAASSVSRDSLLWQVSCQEIMADAYLRKGMMGDALKLVKSNYEIGKQAGNDVVVAYSLATMSGINYSFFKYDEALGYVNEAIRLERKNNNFKRVAICLGMKSDILLKLNRIDSSLYCINEALAIDEEANREDKVAIRLSQKADVLIGLKQWKEAKTICQKAREIFNKSDAGMDEAKVLLQLGICERNLNRYDLAEKYLLAGERLCVSIGYKTLLWEIQHELSLLYKDKNQYDKALSYYESSVAVRDSVIEEEYMYQLGDYKAKFDTQAKENQLQLSKEKNRHQVVVIILLSILLALFVYSAYRTWRIAAIRKKREEELAEMNATKDRLFSVLSHDLKNPVAAQKQALDLMTSHFEEFSETEKKEMLEIMRQSTDSLNDHLLQLLEWAMLNIGKVTFTPTNLDLHEIVQSVMDEICTQAKSKEVTLKNEVPQNTFAFADMIITETIVRNLLTNAIKYSFPGKDVEIFKADADAEACVALTIKDYGVGMSEEIQNQVLRKFVNSSRGTSGEKGTGLGLKISMEMAEKNGGTILVKSKENEGSEFTVLIPKSKNM